LGVATWACTTIPATLGPAPPRSLPPVPALAYTPLGPGTVRTAEQGLTVESNFILHLYTWLHSRSYRNLRVEFPGRNGENAVAHLLLPSATERRPAVLVFPILAGSHVVSEGLAKALVHRGFVVLRMERPALELDSIDDPAIPAGAMRDTLIDARRILGWLAARPEVDPERLATAGVSIGGILASTLIGVDERIRAGFMIMVGGGMGEILYGSTEKPVRAFRENMIRVHGLQTRDEFIRFVEPHFAPVDPLSYADRVEPPRVLLVSGRFDRLIRPDRTRALWEAFRRPRWNKVPAGHYQQFPFFWWSIGRGVDHLERALR
jgi:cephalosporin-C deacetylase-like acetyl esterase